MLIELGRVAALPILASELQRHARVVRRDRQKVVQRLQRLLAHAHEREALTHPLEPMTKLEAHLRLEPLLPLQRKAVEQGGVPLLLECVDHRRGASEPRPREQPLDRAPDVRGPIHAR